MIRLAGHLHAPEDRGLALLRVADDGVLATIELPPLPLAIRNLVERVGLDPALAVRMATLNPARALGLDAEVGRVELGRTPGLIVVDETWAVEATVAGGALASRAPRDAAPSELAAS